MTISTSIDASHVMPLYPIFFLDTCLLAQSSSVQSTIAYHDHWYYFLLSIPHLSISYLSDGMEKKSSVVMVSRSMLHTL